MFDSPISNVVCWILAIVTVVGAVNWLFYSQGHDLVAKVFKTTKQRNAVYVTIGICGILFLICKILHHTQHGASMANFSFY